MRCIENLISLGQRADEGKGSSRADRASLRRGGVQAYALLASLGFPIAKPWEVDAAEAVGFLVARGVQNGEGSLGRALALAKINPRRVESLLRSKDLLKGVKEIASLLKGHSVSYTDLYFGVKSWGIAEARKKTQCSWMEDYYASGGE